MDKIEEVEEKRVFCIGRVRFPNDNNAPCERKGADDSITYCPLYEKCWGKNIINI